LCGERSTVLEGVTEQMIDVRHETQDKYRDRYNILRTEVYIYTVKKYHLSPTFPKERELITALFALGCIGC